MEVRKEYGYSPGPNGQEQGFWIWEQIAGGPAAGVHNILWSRDESVAGTTVSLLTEAEQLRQRRAGGWICGVCQTKHNNLPARCTYCGTKPELK